LAFAAAAAAAADRPRREKSWRIRQTRSAAAKKTRNSL
jgi:hypothetical protein